jgi:hypothetical protein
MERTEQVQEIEKPEKEKREKFPALAKTYTMFATGDTAEQRNLNFRRLSDAIREYRFVVRRLYVIYFMAEVAGARITKNKDDRITIEPLTDRSKELLSILFRTHILYINRPDKKGKIKVHKVIALNLNDNGDYYTYERRGEIVTVKKADVVKIVQPEIKSAMGYELRSYVLDVLCPHWKSFMWDAARRDLDTLWTSDDPSVKATKGFLTLQTERNLAKCQHLGMPILWTRSIRSNAKFDKRLMLTVGWGQGEPLTLRVKKRRGKLDPGRSYVWHMICMAVSKIENTPDDQLESLVVDEGYEPGTFRLNSDGSGDFSLQLPYRVPPIQVKPLDQKRSLELAFTTDPKQFFMLSIHDGDGLTVLDLKQHKELSVEAILPKLESIQINSEKIRQRMGACGNRYEIRTGGGHKKARDKWAGSLSKITEYRDNLVKTWNHLWTKRIVHMCKQLDCGTLIVHSMPKQVQGGKDEPPSPSQGLLGWKWQWYNFEADLKYKTKMNGISLKKIEDQTTEQSKPESLQE